MTPKIKEVRYGKNGNCNAPYSACIHYGDGSCVGCDVTEGKVVDELALELYRKYYGCVDEFISDTNIPFDKLAYEITNAEPGSDLMSVLGEAGLVRLPTTQPEIDKLIVYLILSAKSTLEETKARIKRGLKAKTSAPEKETEKTYCLMDLGGHVEELEKEQCPEPEIATCNDCGRLIDCRYPHDENMKGYCRYFKVKE